MRPQKMSKKMTTMITLQHAEWHCRFGSGGIFNDVERTPEPADLEAAEILKQLRLTITKER